MTDRMTFDEISELLARPPDITRTVEYVRRRRCRPYPPFDGTPADNLLPWVKDHNRRCFNCNEMRPEHEGTCWGNASCEIWNYQQCVPLVLDTVAEADKAEAAEEADEKQEA